jgi:hypothetical protein
MQCGPACGGRQGGHPHGTTRASTPAASRPARAASRGTAIFTFRVALDPPQSGFTFRNGQTAIDVTAETLPSRTVIGLDPAAKAPVSVVTR